MELLGERDDVGHVEPGAVADDDDGASSPLEEREGVGERVGGRRDLVVADAPDGAGRRCVVGYGLHLDLVGEHDVRDVAADERVLARERHQLGVIGLGEDGL